MIMQSEILTELRPLSDRIKQIRPSGIREIFDIACANPDGIDLSIGDPDFDIPDLIKEEGIHWIQQGFNHYVSTKGIPDLRDRLREHLLERGIQFEDLLITSGATGAYTLAIMSLISAGDEVLITDPYFVSYANVVLLFGGVPKFINTYPDFRLRAKEIEPLITPKTKAIVINHPNNPTGVVYRREELRLVAEVANAHGLYVISDEIYDRFVFTPEPFVSMGEVSDSVIVIGGFSKSAGMTGWRLGYVSGPKNVIDAMVTFQQYSYVCATSVAQKAAVKALGYDMKKYVERYRQRIDIMYDGLKDHLKMARPGGAFYLFPEAPGGDAEAFVRKAIERKVYVIPGRVFSEKNTHIRVSIAADEEKLKRAVEILSEIAQQM
ncbi:aminotransferase class I/II-fold pyridoxal phosphate-dependent enzyme [bacterium]|nr:aminotransferase class I/II-fold pyridoxal phosphate-dependent enzyme [bacterium]